MKRHSRPFLVTTVLRQLSPRKTLGTSFFAPNPYTLLREPSPAPSVNSDADFRSRLGSIKRKNNDEVSVLYASIAAATDSHTGTVPVISMHDPFVDKVNVDVVKVNSLMEKVSNDLGKIEVQPEVACILNELREAVCIIAKNQGEIVNKLTAGNQATTQAPALAVSTIRQGPKEGIVMTSLGNIAKKQRYDLGPKLLPGSADSSKDWLPAVPARKGKSGVPTSDPEPEQDPKLKLFKESIRDAERSTLVFNLDMGKVPIMNKETISKKATLSLTSMAAKKEKKNTSIPSDDAVAAIDDVLSVTTGMQFFGAQTKTYKHPSDPNSGLYCTIPVKYEFESKDDRIRAETVLRDVCDIHCATPYPPMIRERIKQIITKVKQEHPNNLVKVTVDTNSLVFKAAHRASSKGEGKGNWVHYKQPIPIPESAMDVNIRRVPEGFTLAWPENSPPKSPSKASGKPPSGKSPSKSPRKNSSNEMEVTEVPPAP
jgi:hypothetical protein